MKKAYIIMAHKYPTHLHRLVDRLNDGFSHFFIHIDSKSDMSQFDSLKEYGARLLFIDRFDARWGKYGITLPLLEGLRQIKSCSETFDRIVVLSGQDYPIKSNKAIDDFYRDSPHSIFINFLQIPNLEKWPGKDRGGLYRFDKYYFGDRWYEILCSRTINFLSSYLKFLKRRIPNQMAPYVGSAWITLDMYALDYILKFNEKYPEYLRFHRNTFVADEAFIPMLIGNSKDEELLSRIENREKHFILWENDQSPHPKTLLKSHFGIITRSVDLFARKFDQNVDAEILDIIDEQILLKN
ncbi:MAG: hypothetical protein EOO93_10895 [Pedobacter sp.]|nr:MAG: hypothetical protein EOO93_10895 [Pedobacter sp.]